MAIALFDKFLNTLPITVLEAKDISMVIMIDPPEGLPPSLLAGKGILDTESKTISVYNSDGSAVAHTFDISTTDLQPIETELAAVKSTAEAADTLSKQNKLTLDGIDLSKYAELGEDAEFNALTLKSKLVFSSPDGEEIDFTDSLKFNNGGFTKLSILNGSIDVHTQLSMSGTNQIINMASGGDNDTNAATIGDVKRISTEGSGLKPTDDEWDMLNLPVINVGESNETTSAATVGQVNTVSSVASAADTLSKDNKTRLDNLPPAPDLTPYIKTGDEAELTSVSFTEASEIHFRPESGLILESDAICGEDLEGNKTFIIKDGEFNVKDKVVKEVSDGVEDNDAVNKKQLNQVEAKADANTGNLGTLATSVAGNTSEIASVKTTAGNADTLSKANATRLDNLPPDPTPRVADLEENSLQKDENGYDAKSFKILNLASGEDVDSSAANIGDVKRISTEGSGLKPTDNEWDMLNLPVIHVQESSETDSAATVGQVNAVDSKIGAVQTTANDADTLSKTNAALLTDALLKDEYGWDVDNLNVYNVSRLSRTNNAVNSSGLSIGDADVNLHGDTVGITSGNSATTYAVFTSGGLNLNDYPLTRMGSGGDTDTNAANIGDVKRIATDGSGLKPTDDQWDMLNLPVINVAESETETSAATVGQVKAVESVANAADTLSKDNKTRLDNLPPAPNLDDYAKKGEDVNFATTEVNILKVRKADETSKFSDILIDGNTNTEMNFVGDTHFYVRDKADNSKGAEAFQIDSSGRFIAKQKVKTPILTNLSTGSTDSSSPNTGFIDLSTASKVKVGAKEDVTFTVDGNDVFKVTSDSIDFSDLGSKAFIKQASGQVIDVSVGNVSNVEFTENGLKLTRDVNASNQNLKNVGDIEHSSNAIILGKSTGNLKFRNVGQITRNSTNEANSVTLGDGENTYKSNSHTFTTNDDEDLVKIDSSGLHFRNTHEDSKGDTTIKVDSGNQNTVYDNIGLVYFNTIDKDSGEKKRIFLTSQNGSVTYDHAVRSKEGFTSGTATFNTNTEGAGFVDLRNSGEVKLGAHNKVEVAIAGKKPLEITSNKLDFSNLAETMTINHGHNIDVSVSGTTNVAFKSNGMKLVSQMDGNGQNINHSGDIHFNTGKKLFGDAAAGLQVRNLGALYRGDGNGSNIQFDSTNDVKITGDHIRWFHSDGHQYGGISNTGINLRDTTKIVGLPQGSADTDATNIGHIKELIAEHAPSGGGVEYENYIVRSSDGSKTFYETTANERNAWVVATNNNAGTLTYTFDYSRNGQEVVAGLENKTKRTIIVRMQLRQSTSLTVEVPKYSVFTARYVPDIGHYVYNIGTWFPTEQRVITLDEINPTISSDYKQMTKNIVAAMPNHTTLIGYHNPDIDGASKYKFVTTGKTGTGKEGSKCAVVIHKHTSNHAVGLSTTEGSGRVYSRVLDGTTGIWNTNDTSASFALQEDIPLDSIPEDQIFFTGDNGVLESYIINEDTDEVALRPLTGYNIPKHDSDIAALGVQTEKNRSVTHYFINEGNLSYDWPDEARKPLVEVQVLNTMQQINNSSVTVTDNDEHIYSGEYNTVGSLAINSLGNWANQYVYHNAYKHVSENYYVVFNQGNLSWQIIQADNPHTSIGQHAASVTVQLGGQSSLPETFGSYTIDPNFENIDSLEFLTAEVPVQYDDVNSRVLINFNGAKPSGYVVLK